MSEQKKLADRRSRKRRDGLAPKELKFCHEYVKNFGNASKAAVAAGYNPYMGRDLPKRPEILAKIRELRETIEVRYEITTDRIMQEMAKLAFGSIDAFTEVDEDGDIRVSFRKSGPADRATISELTSEVYYDGKGEDAQPVKKTKIKLHSKVQALDQLARIHRMFGDREQDADTADSFAAKMREAMKQMKEADGV